MKPPPFELLRPSSSAEAMELLGELGEDAKVLAGGQSLLPLMAMRLAQPKYLIDLNSIEDFTSIVPIAGGGYRLGPLVRHHDAERLAGESGVGSYIRKIAPLIAHLPIRIRGTIAGSLAHADPASEWCVAMLAAEASVTLGAVGRERSVAMSEFLQGPFTTSAAPDELVTEVTVPGLCQEWGLGFHEISLRPGDFALAIAAAAVRIRSGRVAASRIVIGGVSGGPRRCENSEVALTDCAVSPDAWDRAGSLAMEHVVLTDDTKTSAEHRRELIKITVRRALAEAAYLAEKGG